MRRFHCAVLAAVAVVGFASVASAADISMKAAPMVALVAANNWTGWYAGLNAGYSWSNNSINTTATDGAAFIPFGTSPLSAALTAGSN